MRLPAVAIETRDILPCRDGRPTFQRRMGSMHVVEVLEGQLPAKRLSTHLVNDPNRFAHDLQLIEIERAFLVVIMSLANPGTEKSCP